MELDTIICGDCLEVMKDWPDNQIDTIITDPPYGLGFMGKEWDTFSPENVEKEKMRDTLSHKRRKPGKGPHSDRPSAAMAAGRYDRSTKANKIFQQWFTIWGKEALRVLKPGGTLLIFGGTRTYHRLACAIEDAGFILKDCIMWLYGSGFPKATDISKQLDKGHKREVIAYDERFKGQTKAIGGNGKYGGLTKENVRCTTAPATPEAQLWNGWKSHGLKPAYEPILVAMKPNDGTYAGNALKWGVSGLNIDGGRIGTEKITSLPTKAQNTKIYAQDNWTKNNPIGRKRTYEGRFPANVILDEEAAAMLDEQSGIEKRAKTYDYTGEKQYQVEGFLPDNKPNSPSNRGDSGGASRFFYCAKASKSERNAGCEGMASAERSGKMMYNANNTSNKPSKGFERFEPQPMTNHHPTVKPLALMEYLCKLTKTPTGGVVLDCFGGSGSTAIACINTGRNYILIEKDPEYCEIAKCRIDKAKEQLKGQMGLFE